MASTALIDTSNRLLGWSTNDFSLYGGQAAVTIGAPATLPQVSDGLTVPDPAAEHRGSSTQAEPMRGEAPQLAEQPQGDVAGTPQFTPFTPAPIQFGDPLHAGSKGEVIAAGDRVVQVVPPSSEYS